ncbi:hypothetical protein N9L06_05930, partial [Mariniblastus sp.]|nr:hypothetical protein [Mariniblastus sp.]
MTIYQRRQDRITKWRRLFRPFLPINMLRFRAIWTAFTCLIAGLLTGRGFETVNSRRFASRAGMIRWGGDKKKKKRKNRKTLRGKSKLEDSHGYNELEPRQLLATLYVGNSDSMLGNTVDFQYDMAADDVSPTGFSAGDTVTWLGADQALGGTGSDADVTGLEVGLTAFDSIQDAINVAASGDSVVVAPGFYGESPDIDKSLDLLSIGGRDVTTIQLQTGSTFLGALTISGAGNDVMVDGFTIAGIDGSGATDGTSNIVVESDLGDVVLQNNRIQVGAAGTNSTGDNGLGLVTFFSTTVDTNSLTVTDNIFEPLTSEGRRAFYINPGVDEFTFSGNEISGNFTNTSIIQAKDGLVEENIVTGTGASAGLGTWGNPDASIYGHTTFRANSISLTGTAISLFEPADVIVENNFLDGNGTAVAIRDFASGTTNVDVSTVSIFNNSLDSTVGVDNDYVTPVDAFANWWGTADDAVISGTLTSGQV